MAENIDQNIFPPGWECKFDKRTGKHYYINYLTKMTSWEDPRIRQKSHLNHNNSQHYAIDVITQSGHASPYHVYPYSSSLPPQHAFQPPPYLITHNSPKAIPKQILQEMGGRSHGSPLSGGSPVLGRTLSLTPRGSPGSTRPGGLTKSHDSPITLAPDTDSLVSKISSMFPTVSETHIRILLKKYYNREAVVISALQVEKHPISTPGPFSTPPAGQSRLAGVAAMVMAAGGSPLGGSPRASPPLRPHSGASGTLAGSPRSAIKPHTSPKMKLRYLKSVFPKAEETLILDVLASEDNNVLKSGEKLQSMGYQKKDAAPPRLSLTNKENEAAKHPPPPSTPPRLKSIEEKQALKEKFQKKYASIPERVVSIALESVDWSEERAEQILSVVLQEDVVNKKSKEPPKDLEVVQDAKKDLPSCKIIAALTTPSPVQGVSQLSEVLSKWKSWREPNHLEKANRRHKNKKESTKLITPPPTDNGRCYKSQYSIEPKGPNRSLAKGAQDQLLLVDYVTWNGSNPELKSGPNIAAKGSVKTAKESIGDSYTVSQPRGSNKDLCKGPSGLAKGSIYKHINKTNNLTQMKVGGD